MITQELLNTYVGGQLKVTVMYQGQADIDQAEIASIRLEERMIFLDFKWIAFFEEYEDTWYLFNPAQIAEASSLKIPLVDEMEESQNEGILALFVKEKGFQVKYTFILKGSGDLLDPERLQIF